MNGVTFRYSPLQTTGRSLAQHGLMLEDVRDDPGVSTYYFSRGRRRR